MASGTVKKMLCAADFITDTFSIDNKSISANSGVYCEYSIGKPGYRFLGTVTAPTIVNATSSGSNAGACVLSQQDSWGDVGSEVIGLNIRNVTSSAAKVKVIVNCLYVRV